MITIDKKSKELLESPQITVNGVAGINFTNGMLDDARLTIKNSVEAMTREELKDKAWFKENLRIQLKRYIQKATGTKPVIITTVVEV